MKKFIEKEILEKIVSESKCKRDVMRLLKWPISGNNNRLLTDYICDYQISISHFDDSIQRKTLTKNRFKWTDEELFTENSQISRAVVRRRYKQISEYKCECSNSGFHNGKPLVLQLDHINGIKNDHRKQNLRWLCPNCHSQTSTWAGKNVEYSITVCSDCGQPISPSSHRCQICANKLVGRGKTKLHISLPDLENLHKENSLTQIGKMFGVSGNAVKKYYLKLKNSNI